MQLLLDTNVYTKFCFNKSRYKETTSDNQFLSVLIQHFEKCPTTQDLLIKETLWQADEEEGDMKNSAHDMETNEDEDDGCHDSTPTSTEGAREFESISSSLPTDTAHLSATSELLRTSSTDITPSTPTTDVRSPQKFSVDLSLRLPHLSSAPSLTSCPECKYTASSADNLTDHFEQEHRFEGTFSCTCGASYDWLPAFLRHYVTCSVAATDLVSEGFSSAHPPPLSLGEEGLHDNSSSDSHSTPPQIKHSPPLNLSSNVAPLPYPCRRCPSAFAHQADLLSHVLVCPGNLVKDRKPSRKDDSQDPLALDSSGHLLRPYRCSHCVKTFKSKALLDQHLHIHYPPRYTCRFCSKKYRWPPVFYHHQRTCKKRHEAAAAAQNRVVPSPVKSEALTAKPDDSPTDPTPFNLIQQQQHQNLLNILLQQQQQRQQQQLSCLCSLKFTDVSAYIAHINTCPLLVGHLSGMNDSTKAQQQLPQPPGLQFQFPRLFLPQPSPQQQQHFLMSVRHPQPAPATPTPPTPAEGTGETFSCEDCNKDFSGRLSLKQHMEGKHSAQGKYQCPECGKRYRWGASFYYHKKSCPAGGVPCQ